VFDNLKYFFSMSLSSVQCDDFECYFPGACKDGASAFESLSFNIKEQQAYNLLPENYLYDSIRYIDNITNESVCRFKITNNP